MHVWARSRGVLQCLSAQLYRARQETRTHVGSYLSDLRCVVIGQYAKGRSLMDRSICFRWYLKNTTAFWKEIFTGLLYTLPSIGLKQSNRTKHLWLWSWCCHLYKLPTETTSVIVYTGNVAKTAAVWNRTIQLKRRKNAKERTNCRFVI